MMYFIFAFLLIFSIILTGKSSNLVNYENNLIVNHNNILENGNIKHSDGIRNQDKGKNTKSEWWKNGIIYQIYPRSFKDTTGNGLGDLRGVIEKIPYLKYLGIDTVWLNPIHPSAGIDSGYDIIDYRNIDELFGSMDDYDELIEQLHNNGIKILLDFVPNHTSDQHEWFVKSVQNIEPYSDYYVWVDAKYVNGTRQVPNNWISIMKNSMWEWNEQRQQYYLHQFYKEQPDLNYKNPLVQKEIKDVMRFWLDKGVDGFRIDAFGCLYERQDLKDAPSIPKIPEKQQRIGYTKCLDESYDEIKSWRVVLDEYKKINSETKIMTVEIYGDMDLLKKCFGNTTHPGAHFVLNFCLGGLAHHPAKSFVHNLNESLFKSTPGAWPSWVIGNHDIGHPTTTFGEEMIDGIHMVQLLLPGTPVVYMGDELGMTNTYLRNDQSPNDINNIFLRERGRTPFQWDSTAQAGFSNKTITWLPVNPNYVTRNVEYEKSATKSHLKIFKALVNLRKLEVFCTGNVEFYEVSKYVFAFSRSNSILRSYFVILNLGSEIEIINLRKIKRLLPYKMKVRISSLNAEQYTGEIIRTDSFTLRPNAALVLESSFF
ncbi:Glycoside hydrolase superfamily,Nuclease-related domain, NERD,Glycosyl hydrolase, family 13, catalytic [Cinara cedri]|uniref:alpha-glucosidase n=1 Tax=Cinara cedri TaxID=506608 RepID=A0A5E4N6I8_9HEMI|nr:Glycoside hydrolase superfamily,Nuclease-related domain, NERD,Glycosyl hydrolase, family 13, catalytic [Cinara cedri]